MSFLIKRRNITLSSVSILRHFATLPAKPFPDDPTSAYYDDVVAEAGSSGDFNAVRDLLNKRIQDGCFNTKRTFNFITETNFSQSLIDDLTRTLSGINEGFTRKSALDSLVNRLCKLKRVNDALCVVESIARDGICKPNACTFYPVIDLLTREKSLDNARRVVDLMARLDVRLDLTVHNMFLSAHCYAGDLSAAAGALRKLEEEGFRPDTRTFDALVLGACRVGKVEGAMVLVRRMVDDGVPMLYSTHMYVIGALLKMKCYEQAVKYVRIFSGKDKVLDAVIFGCLGSKLAKMNRVNEAMSTLKEMNQRGLPMGFKLREFYEKNDSVENEDSEI